MVTEGHHVRDLGIIQRFCEGILTCNIVNAIVYNVITSKDDKIWLLPSKR